MSGRNAEAGGPREHVGGVLGGLLLLLAIPLIALQILGSRGRAVDAAEVWSEVFEAAPAVVGLEPVQAARLPGGDRIAVLRRPKAASGPFELALVVHRDPRAVAEAMEAEGLPSAEFGRGGPPGRGGSGGEEAPLTLELGVAEWDDLRARYVHTRTRPGGRDGDERKADEGADDRVADKGGADDEMADDRAAEQEVAPPGADPELPIDTVRINLSARGRYAVLYASWPAGRPAQVDELEELLSRLGVRAPEEEPVPEGV